MRFSITNVDGKRYSLEVDYQTNKVVAGSALFQDAGMPCGIVPGERGTLRIEYVPFTHGMANVPLHGTLGGKLRRLPRAKFVWNSEGFLEYLLIYSEFHSAAMVSLVEAIMGSTSGIDPT